MRLIVVDHSINGPGGHYLAYAISLLDAAKAGGLDTALVAGVEFHPTGKLGHELVCAYRYDFFGNKNRRVTLPLGGLRNSLLRKADPARLAKAATAVAARIVIASLFWVYGQIGRFTRSAKEVVRFLLRSLFIPQLFYRATGHSLREVWNYGKSMTARIMRGAVARTRMTMRRNRDTSAEFAKDTIRWLRRLRPGDDDLILFPTISFQDCAGLERALRYSPEFRGAKWCLLFRRNLFPGDRTTYDRAAVAQFAPTFSKLAELVTFFTDSDELSVQYRFAFGGDFHTLPIPHTKGRLRRSKFRLPLCLSYVGDARTEKGFQLLPRVVEDCAADRALKDSVHFAIQANYNVPQGEPHCVVAKSQLQTADGIRVELMDRALAAEQYDRLVEHSDIGLLLYLRENYYARTSGVLLEYLSAGIPVIVPANTWLSTQIARSMADYQNRIVRQMKVLAEETAGIEATGRDLALEFAVNAIDGGFLAIDVQGGDEGLYSLESRIITYDQSRRRRSVRIILYRASGLECGSRLLRLPERVTRVLLRISSSAAGLPRLRIRARLLQAEGSPPPVGVVGLVYDSETDIVRCIREMVSHYDHYKSSALAFADEVNRYHNAPRLIEDLIAGVRNRGGRPEACGGR